MKGKNHPPEGHHKPSQERSVSGDVKVHGALQVFETESAIQQHETERKDDQTYKDATKLHEKAILFVARLTLAVTTLYFVATCLIFLQSKKSADAAKSAADTAARQLSDNRAIQAARIVVSLPPPTVDENFIPQLVMVNGKVVVKNVGQTAAVNLLAIPSIDCGWHPSQNHFVGMTVEKHFGGRTVPPNETAEFSFNQSLGRLEDMVADKCSGAIYVWVSYDDVFNQRYESKYCWEYYRQTKRWGYCPVTEP